MDGWTIASAARHWMAFVRSAERQAHRAGAAVRERVARASRPELKRWGSRILTAASLDDVFA